MVFGQAGCAPLGHRKGLEASVRAFGVWGLAVEEDWLTLWGAI
jgi:hypothetical protein